MRNFVCFLIVSLCLSCENDNKAIEKVNENNFAEVILSGTIKNRLANDTINTLDIYISNLLADEQFKIEKVAIGDLGDFQTSVLINSPQTVTVSYKAVDFNLILKPGDSINVIFNDKYDNNSAVFTQAKLSGSLASLNKDLFKFLSSRKLDIRAYNDKLRILNPDSYKVYHDSIFGADANNIDDFIASNNNIDETLKDWLFVERHYMPADNLLSFPLYYNMFHPEASKTASYKESFYSDLKTLPELKVSNLVNSNINSFGNYIRFHYSKKLNPQGALVKIKTLDSLVIRKIKEDYRDNTLLIQLAVYDILNSSFENNTLDFLNNEEDFIKSLYAQSIFEPIIETRKETVLTLLENPELPKNVELLDFNYDTAEAFIQDLVKNSKKKIIYIDNWAVWCAPCRSEFKEATPKLKKEFSDAVEFVYICHLSDKKLWRPMISQYKLEGKHFFVNDKQNKMLVDYLNITGYPNYNIINPKGEMLFDGFEYRPSVPETTEILKKLTK